MNGKTVAVLLLFASAILVEAPESFARPQYLTNLSTVYGGGSCGTCHVIASGGGQRNPNGTYGQHNPNGTFEPRNPNGTYGQRNSSRMYGQRNSNRTSGARNSNRTFPLNSYGTLFENQPNHATDPSAALIAIGQPPAATTTPEDTPADTASAGTQAAPGFGIVAALAGLFACAILARRHNK